MALAAAIQRKAAELGKLVVEMTAKAGSGHPSSGLSLAHIVTYLMYRQMRYDLADPWNRNADRLVLSQGHAVPIIYAAYADLGGTVGKSVAAAKPLTIADLDQLRTRDSVLDGHPNPAEGFPFFDAATGSLGQGLSVAAGLALGARLDGRDRRFYVLIGDGESREGQIWEAADFVMDHKLTNVCAVFNANKQGQAADVSPQQSHERLAAKLRAFGWDVIELNGHDPDALAAAFAKVGTTERPLGIVARTIKGWGVEQLTKGNWHGKPLTMADLPAAYASLDKTVAAYTGGEDLGRPPAPSQGGSPQRKDPREAVWPTFAEAMEGVELGAVLKKGKMATRRAYGVGLKVAGDLIPQVVSLDGDVGNSTFSDIFGKAYPERSFEGKIAEQNLVSTAAGLSAAGFIPFVNSFGKFLARTYDQVELASISRANIKLVGSHAGCSLGADGPSQMSLADVAYFRAYTAVRSDDRTRPLVWLFHPADGLAAYKLTRLMVEQPGMCYMRTHRPDVPLLYGEETSFEPGGFQVVRGGDDLALVAAGYMVHEALRAADLLAKQGVRATVIDAYCLPIDAERLMEVLVRAGAQALVAEDNYGGGVGAAGAEIAARTCRVRVDTLCCQRIPKSALTADDILDLCGVSARQIADHAAALLARPR